MAATPDMDVIKDIPGYKVILKAVLKSQIQQLVEQLASTTDEESVILTASVSDGTLSHLGSDSGKFFLDDHEDIKSQFLGFCLKRHHKKKQEKERQEALRNMPTTPSRYMGPGGPRPAMIRSPRFSSPRQPHPVALTRAPIGTGIRSPGMRHSPYPMGRPPRRTSLNFEQQSPSNSGPNTAPMKLPLSNNQVIKIEPDDEDSNQSAGDSSAPVQSDSNNTGAPNISSQSSSSSPSQTLENPSVVKSETSGNEGAGNDIPNAETSDAVPPEGLSLDSDLSNLIASETSRDSGNNSQPQTPQSGGSAPETSNTDIDPNVNVKVEAISESEMELEITGVEPGRPMNPGGSQDNWGSGQMGYDPTGATGSQADMQAGDAGYNLRRKRAANSDFDLFSSPTGHGMNGTSDPSFLVVMVNDGTSTNGSARICPFCGRSFRAKSKLSRHMRIHTGEKPFQCDYCQYRTSRNDCLKIHMHKQHNQL